MDCPRTHTRYNPHLIAEVLLAFQQLLFVAVLIDSAGPIVRYHDVNGPHQLTTREHIYNTASNSVSIVSGDGGQRQETSHPRRTRTADLQHAPHLIFAHVENASNTLLVKRRTFVVPFKTTPDGRLDETEKQNRHPHTENYTTYRM